MADEGLDGTPTSVPERALPDRALGVALIGTGFMASAMRWPGATSPPSSAERIRAWKSWRT